MGASGVARLAAAHDVLYDPSLVDDAPRLRELASGADAFIVRNRTQVRGELLAALTRCRLVARLGVGLDNIDTDACAARGIAVIAAVGANAQSVAEYVIASAMLLLRGVYRASDDVIAGRWPRDALSQGPRDRRQGARARRLRLDRPHDGGAGAWHRHARAGVRRLACSG